MRFKEPPAVGLVADLMWADPSEDDTGAQEKEWLDNKKRSCSYIFGQEATNKFLEANSLLCVVRAHEV